MVSCGCVHEWEAVRCFWCAWQGQAGKRGRGTTSRKSVSCESPSLSAIPCSLRSESFTSRSTAEEPQSVEPVTTVRSPKSVHQRHCPQGGMCLTLQSSLHGTEAGLVVSGGRLHVSEREATTCERTVGRETSQKSGREVRSTSEQDVLLKLFRVLPLLITRLLEEPGGGGAVKRRGAHWRCFDLAKPCRATSSLWK